MNVDLINRTSYLSNERNYDHPRVVVLSPNMFHPRYHRRVNAILSAGYRVTVYSFERSYYKCNAFPADCEVVNMGCVKDGHYFERIFKILSAAKRVRCMEHMRKPAALVYAFELDCAVLGSIALKTPGGFIYEIGDLRSPTSGPGLLGHAIKRAEDILLQQSSLLVNTSAAFIDFFIEKRYPGLKEKTLIIENRLPKSIVENSPRPSIEPSRYPLRVGYVGLLRYENTFSPLLETIAKHKDRYSLHIYGDGPLRPSVEKCSTENSNIHYYGPFKNPEDMMKIYNSIDLCFVVYDNKDLNVRLALPNKLYEAAYFHVPLLVASETALFGRVKDWNIGWSVEPRNEDFLEKFFCELSLEDVNQKKRNCGKIDPNDLVENWGDLHDRLRALVDKSKSEPFNK